MSNIAVVIPSIRPLMIEPFSEAWRPLFDYHKVEVVVVEDGDTPFVLHKGTTYTPQEIMGDYTDIIFNKNDGIRNLGFAFVKKRLPDTQYIFTTDDDCFPVGDTLADHLAQLGKMVPISWLSTTSEYTRGFPYEIRKEALVVLSHGVWEGIKDYDAPTQLIKGNPETEFYKGQIPKGVYFPMCIMNVMFDTELLPFMYQFPMGPRVGVDRFADIWSGIVAKREMDKRNWAAVSGYARILHKKASNVFVNLQKEALGISLNEGFWKGDENHEYFKLYHEKRKRWEEFICDIAS